MSTDKRTGWLAELKVGDSVWTSEAPSLFSTTEQLRQQKVCRITPTGYIVTDNWAKYDPTGRSVHFDVKLVPETPEILAEAYRLKLRKAVSQIQITMLTVAQLEAILAVTAKESFP